MAARVALGAVALLALAAAAHATCYCNTLVDFVGVRAPYKGSRCLPASPTPANVLANYTFTVGKYISGAPLGGACHVVARRTALADLAASCAKLGSACKGFTLDYKTQPGSAVTTKLQVCYWGDVTQVVEWGTPASVRHVLDARCYGVWVRNTPPVSATPPSPQPCSSPSPPPAVVASPPPCASPSPPPVVVASPPPCASPPAPSPAPPPPSPCASPPPPPVYVPVPGPCDCTAKYGAGSLAESKCMDCKRTRPDAGDLCCSCRPNNQDYMTVICIDCVVTAHPMERAQCEPCNAYYQDGTNGLVRCWECVKLANYKPAYVPGYTSKVDMCHNFCRMLPTPRWPGMNDPSQCLDCVKDTEAGWFVQVPGNANGQCPAPPSSGYKV